MSPSRRSATRCDGLAFIDTNPHTAETFRFVNRAMPLQRVHALFRGCGVGAAGALRVGPSVELEQEIPIRACTYVAVTSRHEICVSSYVHLAYRLGGHSLLFARGGW